MKHCFLSSRRPLLEQYVGLSSGEYWVSDPHQHSDVHHHDEFKWSTVENLGGQNPEFQKSLEELRRRRRFLEDEEVGRRGPIM